MGGIVQVDTFKYVSWTGGKPKPDWSGLATPLNCNENPNQLRSVGPKSTTSYNLRRTGREEKYKSGGNLETFVSYIVKHLKNHGMDSIAYRPDPQDPTKMIHAIQEHPRFNIDSVRPISKTLRASFDSYDLSNDDCALEFLLNSLDADTKDFVEKRLKPDEDTFVDAWYLLLKLETPYSADRFKLIEKRIESRVPHHYPAQNLIKMCEDLRSDIKQCSVMYDPNLTLTILKNLITAGGDDNQDYKGLLQKKKFELEAELPRLFHLSNKDKEVELRSKNLGWEDILDLAEQRYQLQNQSGNVTWPPALSAKDSKAVPSQFASINQVRALLTSLMQTSGNQRACHLCGKTDHLKKDCPQNTSDGNGNHSGSSNNRGGSNRKQNSNNGNGVNGTRGNGNRTNGNNGNGHKKKNSRLEPPSSGMTPASYVHGEPVFEKMINGRKFTWCKVCKRWSTTHHSGTHTGGQVSNPSSNTAATSANCSAFHDFDLVPMPSAWLCDLSLPSVSSLLTEVRDTFLPHFIGAIIGGILMWALTDPVQAALWLCPSLWLVLFLGSFIGPSVVSYLAPEPPEPRWKRRKIKQSHQKWKKRQYRMVPGSIRDHGLHRSYPRKHRSNGHYFTTAPGVNARNILCACHEILQAVLRVERQLRHRKPGPRGSDSKPGPRGSDSKPGPRGKDPKPGQRGRVKHHEYCPVQASNFNGPSNINLTHRRAAMAKKFLCHIHMARVNLIPNLHQSSTDMLRALLTSPQLNLCLKKEDSFEVIWDSGASVCISNDRNDFVGPLIPAPFGAQLSGMAKGLRIHSKGHVLWSVLDKQGRLRHLKLPAYFVPNAPTRLLSTTVLLQTYHEENIHVTATSMCLLGKAGDPTKGAVEANVSPLNNLPTTVCYRYDGVTTGSANLAEAINEVHQDNHNLSEPEKELLRWHYRLGHVSLRVVQFLFRMGVLSASTRSKKLHTAASKITHPPKCAACQFGKQHSRPVPGKKSTTIQDRAGAISSNQVQPGQRVSIDHFVCSTKGRLFSGYGIPNSETAKRDPKWYTGGCIFVDESTNFVHIEFQAHLNTHETLAAVEAFEKHALDSGVIVQSYTADNGTSFTSRGFLAHLSKFAQTIRHSGPGSHHQNGKAERSIQTIMAIARTMMLHAAIHWPDVSDPTLWPMAVTHAVWLWNHLPNTETGLSPHDLWTKTRWPLRSMTFTCLAAPPISFKSNSLMATK